MPAPIRSCCFDCNEHKGGGWKHQQPQQAQLSLISMDPASSHIGRVTQAPKPRPLMNRGMCVAATADGRFSCSGSRCTLLLLTLAAICHMLDTHSLRPDYRFRPRVKGTCQQAAGGVPYRRRACNGVLLPLICGCVFHISPRGPSDEG
jgi:hypothetical protein